MSKFNYLVYQFKQNGEADMWKVVTKRGKSGGPHIEMRLEGDWIGVLFFEMHDG